MKERGVRVGLLHIENENASFVYATFWIMGSDNQLEAVLIGCINSV